MIFKKRLFIICLVTAGLMFASCQKELDLESSSANVITPVKQKPKVGTRWTYVYYRYYPWGGLDISRIVVHFAASEETLGGEKWLNIIDTATQATVYYLNTKTGGLYLYTNNTSNLYCKFPATINEVYTSAASEQFTVKGVLDTLPTGVGDIPVMYYEGAISGTRSNDIWFNEYAWIVRWYIYFKPMFNPVFRREAYFLQKIEY